ncbi:S49 family peptidase [Mucilaginibacter sp. Bleaf8]|uniref:S49 family peptidase n=1 Tax=Mucilaginibacter sp. Bleaf8 TaxID=2834430 RepID=UPI001BD0B386|nr:S49 family peptidase [Mucilaginibacter sp. Bleaf8]MBS7565101.1 S49 family peptidase [Mucilaginibacter sp. Bleaf8]
MNSEFHLISAILRNAWLLDAQWAKDNISIWANVLEGKSVNFGQAPKPSPDYRVSVITAGTLFAPSYFSGFEKAPKGSFAKIDLIGPLMKYGYCSSGSYELTQLVQEAKANDNIRGLFIEMDCPGGQVSGTSSLADAINDFGKPSLAFVNDGLMCSGGVWTGLAADEVYASHELNTIGGIGVYQTIQDHSERLKAMGIKVIDRYAPESTEKNKTYRDAMKGNYDLLDESLSAVAQTFIQKVTDYRGDRLQGKPSAWNKGQDGSASWAQEIGLIDGILSYSAAFARLEEMADGADSKRKSSSSSFSAHNPDLNINMKFPKLFALAGKTAASQDELAAVNAELTEAGITAFGVHPESVVTDAAEATQANAKLTTDLATANSTIGTLTAENTALKAKVAEAPAAAAPVVPPADPKVEKTEAEKEQATIAGFAHNQFINSFFGGR